MKRPDRTTVAGRGLLAGVLVLGGIFVIGSTAASAAPRTIVVTLSDMNYGPIPRDLKVGDTIMWVNHDTVSHTVTARNHSFDLRVNPGKSVPQLLDKPGAIAFYCTLHAAMRGTLNVAEK